MKPLLVTALIAGLTAAPAVAVPDYGVIGAAAGAAAGFVVANNVDGVSKAVAVPVLAVVGGIAGHKLQKAARHHRVTYGDYVPVRPAPSAPSPAAPDLQPGVDLIKISILNSNGVRTDIPILRTGGRFIGPQGESYPALPTSEELRQKYGR